MIGLESGRDRIGKLGTRKSWEEVDGPMGFSTKCAGLLSTRKPHRWERVTDLVYVSQSLSLTAFVLDNGPKNREVMWQR